VAIKSEAAAMKQATRRALMRIEKPPSLTARSDPDGEVIKEKQPSKH
jgi:hypothetical protein